MASLGLLVAEERDGFFLVGREKSFDWKDLENKEAEPGAMDGVAEWEPVASQGARNRSDLKLQCWGFQKFRGKTPLGYVVLSRPLQVSFRVLPLPVANLK